MNSRWALLFFAFTISVRAIDDSRLATDNRLADAIYHAEGGAKARVPYGILGVRVRSHAEARAVCLRTIRTARAEWDGRGDLVSAVGRRYCPPSVDPRGHRNWVRNVRFFYGQ